MTTTKTETHETLTEPIKIRFDRDVHAALEREANAEDRAFNYIVRRHLRESVARKAKAAARRK